MKPTSVVILLVIFGSIAFGQAPSTPVDSDIVTAHAVSGER